MPSRGKKGMRLRMKDEDCQGHALKNVLLVSRVFLAEVACHLSLSKAVELPGVYLYLKP